MNQDRIRGAVLGNWHAVVGCIVASLTIGHLLEQLWAVDNSGAMLRLRIDRVDTGLQWKDWIFLPLAAHILLSLAQLKANRFRENKNAAGRITWRGAEVARAQCGWGLLLGAFLVAHIVQFRWPRWNGTLEQADVGPALTALLSATWYGIPVQAGLYLGAVTLVSIYVSRGAAALLAAGAGGQFLAQGRPWGFVLSIVLGSFLFLIGALAIVMRATGLFLR